MAGAGSSRCRSGRGACCGWGRRGARLWLRVLSRGRRQGRPLLLLLLQVGCKLRAPLLLLGGRRLLLRYGWLLLGRGRLLVGRWRRRRRSRLRTLLLGCRRRRCRLLTLLLGRWRRSRPGRRHGLRTLLLGALCGGRLHRLLLLGHMSLRLLLLLLGLCWGHAWGLHGLLRMQLFLQHQDLLLSDLKALFRGLQALSERCGVLHPLVNTAIPCALLRLESAKL